MVEEWIPAEIEEAVQFVGGFELARVPFIDWSLCLTSLSADLLDEQQCCSVFVSPNPLVSFVMSMSLLICLLSLPLIPYTSRSHYLAHSTCICSSIRILFSYCYLVFGI